METASEIDLARFQVQLTRKSLIHRRFETFDRTVRHYAGSGTLSILEPAAVRSIAGSTVTYADAVLNRNPMKAIPVVIALLIGMWILVVVSFVWYESKHPCLKYEDKLVHYDEFTTMEPETGINLSDGEPVMTVVPVYHPAYDSVEHVCVSQK